MYWNMVNDGCYEFTRKFGYAPNEVYMSRDTYSKLEQEMFGEQWWHLVKHNSVRGLHVRLDENVEVFKITGKDGDYLIIK